MSLRKPSVKTVRRPSVALSAFPPLGSWCVWEMAGKTWFTDGFTDGHGRFLGALRTVFTDGFLAVKWGVLGSLRTVTDGFFLKK